MTYRPFLQIAWLGALASGVSLGWCAEASAQQAPAAQAPAAAQEDSPARKLFKEGRELAAKGDYAAACPKFEQSLALEGGLGTQFNLADCWERVGRTASARALFIGAAASAKAAGQTEREQVLRERAEALTPRISKLVVEVSSTAERLTVKRDDLPLEPDAWGKAVAVDPGGYEIIAKAPGRRTWTKKVEVKAGAQVITVEVPELEKLEPAAKPEPEKPTKKALAAAEPERQGTPHKQRYKLTPTTVTLGVIGVGNLVLGTVMGIRYMSANDQAKTICPSGHDCTPRQISNHEILIDRASSRRTWAYIGFGIGAASLATAAVMFFMPSESESESRTSLRALPVVDPGQVGASVSGSF